jgi:hypothetical protein
MKIRNFRSLFVSTLLFSLTTSMLSAQADKSARPSPPVTVTGKIKNATITINYSSPSVKGRKVFGGLVPYGKAWRTGANEATTFETDKAVTIEGKKLAAGKYSFFAIPGEKEWTIIFNTQTGQWGIKRGGDANYDPAANVLTATVKPKATSAMNERLTYEINKKGFVLKWENVQVPVSVK